MFAFAAVVLLLWILTFVQTVTNLLTIPRLRRSSPPDRDRPLVSVVIPARNEAAKIGATVEAFLAQTWTKIEIIVLDDHSDDATGEIVSALSQRDPKVRVVRGAERPEGWLGKPWALSQGALEAKGEWMLLVDADVRYAPEALESIVAEASRNPECAMLFLFPRFEMRGFWENVVMPALPGGLFMGIPVWLANRTTIPILGVGGGVGNFVRRDAYESIGGHARLRNAVIDDIGLARLMRAFGFRTRVLQADHLVSLRMYHGAAEIIEGFTKNSYMVFAGTLPRALAVTILAFALHLSPWIFTARWLVAIAQGASVPAPLAMGGMALVLLLATRLAMFASLGYNIAAALLTQPLEVVVWQWIFFRSAWRLGVRKRFHWRGRHYSPDVTAFGDFQGITKVRAPN